MLHQIFTDARFGLRLLRRNPGFGVTLLSVLIIGIGATTAMFSLVLSLLVRPLPYPHADELTMIWATQPQVNPSPVSIPDFLDWRAQATTFSSMAAVETDSVNLSSEASAPESLPGANVSGDYFTVMGISALRGRLFGIDDDRPGAPRVVVISAALWHRRFGSDPGIIGRTVTMNAEAYTIIGVAPEGYRFSGPYSTQTDLWTPLAVSRPNFAKSALEDRGSHYLHVIGRRRPGVTLGEAQAQLTSIAKSLEQTYPDTNLNDGVRVVDLQEQLVGSSRQGIWLLFAAVGLVFIVVCANVANLLLARAGSRRGEMAARAALGATRGRLVAQLLAETVTVFLLGAVGGAVLAHWLVDLFAQGLIRSGAAFTIDIRVDGTALAFAAGIAIVFGAVFGLVPALEASRVQPQAVLKESGTRASVGGSQRAVRSGLVIAQVALACALLAAAGLSIQAFQKASSVPLGFDTKDVAVARIDLPPSKYASEDKAAAFFADAVERLAAEPGVTSAGASTSLPMAGSNWSGSFQVEGRAPFPAGARPTMERNVVTVGYFKTLGIPILRGRDFDASDTKQSRRVMVISQSAAELIFPGEDPIGKRIDWGNHEDGQANAEWREIVGIVGNVRRIDRAKPIGPESYVPLPQSPLRWASLVVKTQGRGMENVLNAVPEMVREIDPEQAVSGRRTLEEMVARTRRTERFTIVLLVSFAVVALLLATLGIFGLVSYTTTQRTRELGIRVALGAPPEGVIAVVMRDGLRLLAIGVGVGLVGMVLVGQALAGRVVGAVAFDPVVTVTIIAVLGLAGTLASFFPALRAVRIPPATALRYE